MTTTHAPSITQLPPLILHPFSDQTGPQKLVKSSRASLMLRGLLPSGSLSNDDLDRTLLDGRYCEIRMLYYVGKDLARWIEQCLDMIQRAESLRQCGIEFQSIAAYLIETPPAPVAEKLRRWGVVDFKAIFSRALGLNAIFADVPEPDSLSIEFIRHYYRYADQLFQCRQEAVPFTRLESHSFTFDLYASGEYSRLLEREWQE